jgi:hypothetical protein
VAGAQGTGHRVDLLHGLVRSYGKERKRNRGKDDTGRECLSRARGEKDQGVGVAS